MVIDLGPVILVSNDACFPILCGITQVNSGMVYLRLQDPIPDVMHFMLCLVLFRRNSGIPPIEKQFEIRQEPLYMT